MTTNFDKNLLSCEYQLSSIIQRISRGTKSRRSEASKSKES